MMSRLPKNLFYAARSISTTRVNHCQSLVKKKTLQAKFQADDGKPVWLKGGFNDRVLYTTTIALCVLGVMLDVAVIYNHAKPPSWKNPVC